VIDKVFAGRYRITEKIGIGGMAEVYKATDETLGRTVAVKVMLPQYASDETFAVRFKQEAQAAANLQSPYIVNIYDWGFEQTSQTYYIVMEYIRGTDLKTAITQRGAINQRKVAEIGAQVSAALGVAHSYDIIHRDIKPQNIMVQPDGNAKVMDFGIARANSANLTQTGSVLGTAYYVSPEQAQGKELSPATDIYSLGVVLYEAVTGRVPFDGSDAVSIAVKQVNEMPTPPRAFDNTIDESLEAIILKAMRKNPSERYRTADEMRMALSDYLQGKPLSSARQEARTQVITTPAVVPPAAATAVMPELGGNATHMRAGGSGSSGSRGHSSSQRSNAPLIVTLVALLVVLFAAIAVYFIYCSNDEARVEVPQVVQTTEDEAKRLIQAEQLDVGEITHENSETVAAGLVVSQNPTAGSRVAVGTKVNLVISIGSGNIEVPNVVGMTPAEAELALSNLSLQFEAGESKSDANIESGKIIATTPPVGSKVAAGTKIVCIISSGPESAQIPNVIGFWKTDAENTLVAAGFVVVYDEDIFSGQDAGRVANQSQVGAGTPGQTVTLALSKGLEPTPTPTVSVPNIVGMTLDTASNALASRGLILDYSGDVTGMTITSQTPAAGESVDEGTAVTAIFSAGDPPEPPEQD